MGQQLWEVHSSSEACSPVWTYAHLLETLQRVRMRVRACACACACM